MIIDEEIGALTKGMDHDFKRLRSIIATYKSKKGLELNSAEVDEREEVATLVKDCYMMF